jgi:hypothetical protein
MDLGPFNKEIKISHDHSHVYDTNSHNSNDDAKEKNLRNHFATAKRTRFRLNFAWLIVFLVWFCTYSFTVLKQFSILLLILIFEINVV